MCGITLLISPSGRSSCFQPLLGSIQVNNLKRGPDQHCTLTLDLPDTTISLSSSVLGLRGQGVTSQPLLSPDNRYLFAWNGQIFHFSSSSKLTLDAGQNDGEVLFHYLLSLLEGTVDLAGAASATFAQVEGPYAFVLIDKVARVVVFGRDPLGRRSLLIAEREEEVLLASVGSLEAMKKLEFKEVDCSSLWSMNLQRVRCNLLPVSRDSPRLVLQPPLPDYPPRTREERHSSSLALEQVLSTSIRARVTPIRTTTSSTAAHVAILFSGGLDCATLALLSDRFIPPEQDIDLLNVGFENPRSLNAARKAGNFANTYDVPDRLTGQETYKELQKLAPKRKWNFVEINVTYKEYCEKEEEVEALMYPTASVMDLSIASALYFASRGRGVLTSGEEYTTPARVLLSGLGADELLGGYSRHRNAFERNGWPALVSELQMDLYRLPTRNLGRDDRVLSIHGREARYPYLDRSVLEHLTSLPVIEKTDPRLGQGVGDKIILRHLAARLGLTGAAALKKRAMQFGTRAAKIDMDQGRVKGHEMLH